MFSREYIVYFLEYVTAKCYHVDIDIDSVMIIEHRSSNEETIFQVVIRRPKRLSLHVFKLCVDGIIIEGYFKDQKLKNYLVDAFLDKKLKRLFKIKNLIK